MKTRILLLVAVLIPAATLFATDLRNEDSRSYDIRYGNGTTTNSSIGGNTTVASICSGCNIEVVGVGTISASAGETVVIKDGALSKR